MKSKAFYLKVNRTEEYAMRNLSRWIDASYLMDADCYIICDDASLNEKIKTDLLIYRELIFMPSEKNEELAYIVNAIANRNWINASFAHLTSIQHGCNNYDHFWNIDADDTRFCVTIDKMVEILKKAELYAEGNEIDCFSLDMWNSETGGRHWSFGVAYMNGRKDMIGLCKSRCRDLGYQLMDKEGNQNIDWFFTYLKKNKELNIATFYIENLKFLHYSNDFFERPVGSGLYHWSKGHLIYPLMYYGIGIEEQGSFPVQEDNIRLDVDVTDAETSSMLVYYTREGKDLKQYYDIDTIVNDELCRKKYLSFIQKHGFTEEESPEIICFGAGNALEKNLQKIRKINNFRYACDNDPQKWGKELFEEVICIRPEEICVIQNPIIIILVYSRNMVDQIAKQLRDMNVEYDFMDNFFRCVE